MARDECLRLLRVAVIRDFHKLKLDTICVQVSESPFVDILCASLLVLNIFWDYAASVCTKEDEI